MAPMSRSRLGQPSSRRPMPGANPSSTAEWQRAHWMPTDVIRPWESKKPVTPTTTLAFSRARVLAGSPRSTFRALRASARAAGSAETSTFRPRARACFGESPGPTPPFFSPAIARWSWRAPPQNPSLPNVSLRKVVRPSSRSRRACSAIVLSNPLPASRSPLVPGARVDCCMHATPRTSTNTEIPAI
jgi:hypothetical protein